MADEWSDPPPHAKANPRYREIAKTLRERPGEWLKVDTDRSRLSTFVWAIRTGRIAAFRPTGDFEAVTREGGVWVRYVPDLYFDKEKRS